MNYVSVEKASKLLLVSTETILKWIEDGKLEARMTPDKYYVISRESVRRLLVEEESLIAEIADGTRPTVPCWDYYAEGDTVKDLCRFCQIFQNRDAECYKVAKFLREHGLGATCCSTGCKDCSYYKYKEQIQKPQNFLDSSGSKAVDEAGKDQQE